MNENMVQARLQWVRDLSKANLPFPGEAGLAAFAAGWTEGLAASAHTPRSERGLWMPCDLHENAFTSPPRFHMERAENRLDVYLKVGEQWFKAALPLPGERNRSDA